MTVYNRDPLLALAEQRPDPNPFPPMKVVDMKQYIKAIIAVLGGISAWGITAAADNAITQVELYGLLGTLATALGVYAFPNTEDDESGQTTLWWVLLGAVAAVVLLLVLGWVNTSPK